MSVKEVTKARQSVRKYDTTVELTEQQLLELIEEATTAPSSHNLQPWRFLIFRTEEARRTLRPIAFNQEQVEHSSAVIAVIGNRQMYNNAPTIYDQMVAKGQLTEEQKQRRIETVMGYYASAPEEVLTSIATFDTGLVSMQIMLLAKERGLDTVAMGGFDKAAFHEAYGLASHEFPAVLIAIGKGDEQPVRTPRIPAEQLTRFL